MSEQNAINPTIRQKLSRLQTLLRGRLLLEGLGWVILAFCVALLATFSLDYLLRLEEVPLRLMVMLVAAGGVMAVLIRTVLLPQLVTMDTDNLALLIERRYGVLSDRLISALQLARRTDHEKVGTSRAMIRRVGEELDGMIEKVRFEDVVETDRLRRVVIAALFLAAAVFTLVIYNSNLFSIWYQRNILLSETAFYPQRTYLVVQGGPDFQVHDGEDKQILVRVSKDSTFTPPEITLHRVYNPGEDPVKTIVPYRPKKEDDPNSGAYVIEFKNVSSPFKFYVTGGDDTQDRRKPHHVTILETIKLDGDLALDVYFPGYQNRRPPEMTLHPGKEEKLAIPAGSTVVVRGVTTKPFKEASLYLNGWVIAKDQTTPESQSGTQDLKFQLQMDRRNKPGHESFLSDLVLSPGGSDFCSAVAAAVRAPATAAATGSRTFGKKHKLIVWAKDMTGFPRELRGHDLQMELDAEPSFSEFRPAFEIATVGDSVTNLVQVPFLIKVEDDYGLTDLQLEYRRDKEPWQLYKIDGRGPIRQAEHEETLIADVAKAHPALKPGETISFRAVAKDSLPRPYGGPNKQASNRVTFSIVDRDTLREELGNRIGEKGDLFQPSIDNQQAAINKLVESHQEIRRGNDISAQVRQQLADTARMQKSIYTNAQNFADSLEAIVSHMERNQIADEEVQRFKAEVVLPLKQRDLAEINEIWLGLSDESVEIDDPRAMAELLANLQRRQQELKSKFEKYYEEAMAFAALQKLISKFGNVRDAAKELEEIIRKYGESGVKDILGG
jgi:hypothetical protein